MHEPTHVNLPPASPWQRLEDHASQCQKYFKLTSYSGCRLGAPWSRFLRIVKSRRGLLGSLFPNCRRTSRRLWTGLRCPLPSQQVVAREMDSFTQPLGAVHHHKIARAHRQEGRQGLAIIATDFRSIWTLKSPHSRCTTPRRSEFLKACVCHTLWHPGRLTLIKLGWLWTVETRNGPSVTHPSRGWTLSPSHSNSTFICHRTTAPTVTSVFGVT